MYNDTAYENVTNLLQMTQATNTVSDGLFFPLCVLLVTSFIIFMSFKIRYDVVVSLVGTTFLSSLIAVAGWGLGLVSVKILFYPIILLIASVIIYMLQD